MTDGTSRAVTSNMPSEREHEHKQPPVDPASQSPDDPIEFCADDDVARGNEERANAEPEPAALHSAEVPGKPDVAAKRRELQHEAERER